MRRQLQGMITSFLFVAAMGLQSPNLLQRSIWVGTTKDWSQRTVSWPPYAWVDGLHVLFSKSGNEKKQRFLLFDIITKKSVNLPNLSEIFARTNGDFTFIRVSPDGQKVLWSGNEGEKFNWYISRLYGTNKVQSFARRKVSRIISNHGPDDETIADWSPDSTAIYESILEFGNAVSTHIWERKISNLKVEVELPIAKGSIDLQPKYVGKDQAFATLGLGIGNPPSSAALVQWNIRNPGSARIVRTVQVPKGRTIESVVPSNSGTRVVWDLYVHNPKSPNPWDSSGEEFWLTDAKGRDWRLLGRLDFPHDKSNSEHLALGLPQWKPGGKAISYTYGDKLYQLELPK